MRRLDLESGATLFALTDTAPAPAASSYAFPDADLAARPDLTARWFPDGEFRTRFGVFALRCPDGRIVLVDAGLGPGPNPYFNGLGGRLPEEMAEAGLDPSEVALAIFSHFHLDHVGWALDRVDAPRFGHARYLAPAAEIAHWRAHGEEAALPHHVAAFRQSIAPLLASGRLEAADPGAPIFTSGGVTVSLLPAPGHTAGHHAIWIEGAGRPVLIAGDSWHNPAQIAEPDWCHRADRDKDLARASRRALAERAVETDALVAAGHFVEDQAFGRIVQDGPAGDLAYRPLPH
jgi:glyoxylase-like metal-dependent hydrolase (beta-lactamase superfamily II)